MMSLACAIEQGFDRWQHMCDDGFDACRGGVQAICQLECGIIYKRLIEGWIEQYIVLLG